MKISMIAAMANNRVIGKDNKMPWHLPADLKHFKAVTLGKPVVMGRLTYESIGRALPGRTNIVVSSNTSYSLPDAIVVNTFDKELALAASEHEEVMIIGGGSIYKHFLSQAHTLYLTFIDLDVEGDTQFPDYNAIANWQEIEREAHVKDDKNIYDYEFVSLEKRPS
jgi:dihydrofolate reductase